MRRNTHTDRATAPAARGSRQRVLGLGTTLDDSNRIYRPRSDVHEARGAAARGTHIQRSQAAQPQRRQRQIHADLCNAQYNQRQFPAPVTSFTDRAAMCATYPYRRPPRQCLSNCLRQHNVSGDRANAARTSKTRPGPRTDLKSSPKRLRSTQQCSMTCGASSTKAACTRGSQAVQLQ